MLIPKKTKYRKYQRGRNRGVALNGNKVEFGEFGLQSLECDYISERQIEAARRAVSRYIKRGGKIWIRIFADKVVTSIPAETRMGKGKGAPDHWVAPVKAGSMIFELGGVDETIAREALRLAAYKLCVKTKIVKKDILELV